MGQILCIAMAVAGIGLLIFVRRGRHNVNPQARVKEQ
jgi:prolipoprotein diacylglyceryltransferase